jgi:SAM-dependent methyltransferase/uncharacterized protein YbaR (Trm112 family)
MLDLHCPYCGGRLDRALSANGYGVLACACNRYPVIAGIPVLRRHAARTVALRHIITLIERGDHHEALLTMLAASVSFEAAPARCEVPGLSRWRRFRAQRARAVWRARMDRLLTSGDRLTLTALLDLGYRAIPTPRPSAYDYFVYRRMQPRYLVALSLISLIRTPTEPLLDLGCGVGHMTAALLHRGQPVIGIDRNFFSLFVAQQCVAPIAHFICYGLDAALPFAERARVAAAVFADGFHYVENKITVIREVRRGLGDNGVMILASTRNAAVPHKPDGWPLCVEDYRQLMADLPHCLLPDADVLAAYWERRLPPLVTSADRVAAAPTVSVVASRRAALFREQPSHFTVWPHAEGRCEINPLYVPEADGAGGWRLRRRFPSARYAHDYPEMADYLPVHATISAEALASLTGDGHTPEIKRLIAQGVLVMKLGGSELETPEEIARKSEWPSAAA